MKENYTLNNDMRKKSFKFSERQIAEEFSLLNATHSYLVAERNKLEAKLSYYIKKMESEFSEEIENSAQEAYQQLQNLVKKIQWEMKQCQNFDAKVELFNKEKHLNIVTGLARKILNKDKNN